MFRFYTNDRWLVWAEEDTYELGPALVGDHNIIAPNILDKLGRWETHYRGDLGYVRGTAGFYGGSAGMLWRKEIITRQRPSVVLFDWPSSSNTRPTYAYTEGIKTGMPLCLREAELTPISQYTFTHQTNPIDGLIAAAQYSYEGDKFWANLFLSRAHTGKGYGRELVQHAVDAAHENCWMEVAETDLPVLHLLNEFGFSRISSANGRIQLMKTFPP
jgi:GNAT superfamily N-acetyltransferase